MGGTKLLFRKSLIFCSNGIASIITFFHYLFIQIGVFKMSSYIKNAPLRTYKSLFYRYRVHVLRAIITLLLRTPLRNSVLKIVNFNIPRFPDSGCIIVTCHTQWEGILVQSCLEKKYGLIIGRRKWKNKKKEIQRKGNGYINLRNIIRHLHQQGRIIIAADSFNKLNNCPVEYRGELLNASKLPVRLANDASVPLIIALPVLSDTIIKFTIGPQFTVNELIEDTTLVTQQIISFIDNQLKCDYRVWSSLGR